ncbi:hypothetical protein GGI25_003493 [Coemansia spiralis]|uniref:RanBD1 domain-containing protein n=2 Tax=Coemansia TaxID=4863 RepID=A0A9W8G6D3_9FUNG|nr:hypothetical protein BX070DRAFT_226098 [Coemansia spiralis]KAJ1991510.1 hypothetical protein EDC05_003434 [Coemansia umbellata]KAJ2621535.1 hypothetical protein GGI26_003998 [Coemansia sp. RSA 1358]KAJ2676741.1 hypothetical protein GGI25_003493 [Coemansia spiralis]
MAKRTAEKQLTQLNQHEEDTEGSSDYQEDGFSMANQQQLALRVIKKPKSRLRGVAAAAATTESAKSAFSGFSGFGSPISASNSNASAATSSNDESGAKYSVSKEAFKEVSFGQTSSVKPAVGFVPSSFGSGFGGGFNTKSGMNDTAEKPTKSAFSFSFGKPAAEAASTQPEHTKGETTKPAGFTMPAFKPPTDSSVGTPVFTGSGKPSSKFTSPFVPPKATTAPVTAPASASSSASSEEEFYKNIRGLNVSLQKQVNDAITNNVFADLTPLLEQYRSHWTKITEKKPENDTSKPTTIVASKESSSAGASPFSFLKSNQSAASKPKDPAEEKKPATESKVEDKPTSTPFKFGSTNISSAPKSNFAFSFAKPAQADSTDEAAKKPFSFGFSQSVNANAAPTPASKPVFAFGFGGTNTDTKNASANSKAEGANNANNDDDEGEEEQEQEAPKQPTTAGEEGDTTEHQVRAKLYMWEASEKKYKDMGVGLLKVNTWETDSNAKRARVLCRQEGSDKITLNAALFKEMVIEYTAGKKDLGILVVIDGKPTRYLIRTSSADSTANLHACIEKVKDLL